LNSKKLKTNRKYITIKKEKLIERNQDGIRRLIMKKSLVNFNDVLRSDLNFNELDELARENKALRSRFLNEFEILKKCNKEFLNTNMSYSNLTDFFKESLNERIRLKRKTNYFINHPELKKATVITYGKFSTK